MGTWLVTGGSGGIGSAICRKVQSTEEHSVHRPPKAQLDLSSKRSIQQYFKYLQDEDVQIDVLVNNAGLNYLTWLENWSYTQAEELFRINVLGYLATIHELLARQPNPPRRIINIGSIAGRVPMTCTATYNASKAAVDMITRSVARELAAMPNPTSIFGVDPGRVSGTHMGDYVDEAVCRLRGLTPKEANDYQMNSIPGKRFVNPQDIAETVYWLGTDAPQSMTGSIIVVGEGVC